MTPYARGLAWDTLVAMGEASTEELAERMVMDKGCLSKLLSKLLRDGYLLTDHNGRGSNARRYRCNPQAQRPVDKRAGCNTRNKIGPGYLAQYDTTPIALECWPYRPSGLEAQYCDRLDARVVELCPQNREAAD